MNNLKAAGCVIIYNSEFGVIENILSYVSQLSVIYAIDNSETKSLKLVDQIRSIPNVLYVDNKGNRGVANALNKAANLAINDGFDYLLTMDDDSMCYPNTVQTMFAFILRIKATIPKIGIISVAHNEYYTPAEYRLLPYTMTSGNLLSLKAYSDIGPFNEGYFIDHIDHEYGIRLNISSYSVIELCSVKLNHSLGTKERIHLYKKDILLYVSHSPLRNYYFFRNGFLLIKKFFLKAPLPCINILRVLFKEFLKILFLEKNKMDRFCNVFFGIYHAFINVTGKKP